MSWQSKIYYKYRLDEPVVKIVSDNTGLLISDSFLSFLISEHKSYAIINSASEIIKELSKVEIVILGYKLTVPKFIKDKNEVFEFSYSDIPVNGTPKLLSNISVSELINLLDYIDAEDLHAGITETNLSGLLDKADKKADQQALMDFCNSIVKQFEKELSWNSISIIAKNWAQLQYQSYLSNDFSVLDIVNKIDSYCNTYFETSKWQEIFYAPVSNPRTVDKIAGKIKHDKHKKNALLCFDCMGLPEWLLLKEYLTALNLYFEESVICSLTPSITSIARSAIYAGTYNVYDKKNPGQYTEEKDFKAAFGQENTTYLKESDYNTKDVLIGYNTVSILFNFFDDLCHSTHIQSSNVSKFGYYNNVVEYLKNSNVREIISDLLEEDYAIYICSDHGSTIAKGNGKKIDKYLHDKFAKRGTVIAKESSELIDYKKIRIPFIDDRLVVIPDSREMFAGKDQYEINHGGISIDEMLVPFIKISKE
ncbi:MAG: PglZ domain-containing protein [Prolixibacteraceae bacterium]|nr:PglZ domain-containing protein [Prolixibacteraceae bacterium]